MNNIDKSSTTYKYPVSYRHSMNNEVNKSVSDANLMEPEVLYKFMDSIGTEIAAFMNAEKDAICWWYTAEMTSDESTWNNKHWDTISQFTRRLNACGLVHTN